MIAEPAVEPPVAPPPSALGAIHHRLRAAETVAELFRLGAAEACAGCGFGRGVVAAVNGPALTGVGRRLADAARPGDDLARRLVASPVPIATGSEEFRAVRNPGRVPSPRGNSVLRAALGLRHYAIIPVVPEGHAVALLVVDRGERPVGAADLGKLEFYGTLLAIELERLVLRTRVNNLAAEVRNLSASVQALVNEALTGPVSPMAQAMSTSLYTQSGYDEPPGSLPAHFTDRDQDIAELLCEGKSNREIADALYLSPETVKDHVARLVRKLDACNRVEAAARFAAMRTGAR